MWKLDPFHIISNAILMYCNTCILLKRVNCICKNKENPLTIFEMKDTLNICIGSNNQLIKNMDSIFNFYYDYHVLSMKIPFISC